MITIDIPNDFSFRRTAISHGWYDLVPFNLDRESWTLRRVLDLPSRPTEVKVRSAGRTLEVETSAKFSKRDEAKIIRDVRHMLRLDDDLSEFYERVGADSRFS